MDEVKTKSLEEFQTEWSEYKSFADLTPEEQTKLLDDKNFKADPEDPEIILLYLTQEDMWVKVKKDVLYNKSWGKKDGK